VNFFLKHSVVSPATKYWCTCNLSAATTSTLTVLGLSNVAELRLKTRLYSESADLCQGQNLDQNWLIWGSNPDFHSNLDWDPDACRIAATMLWIHYLIGVSHFGKRCENQPATIWNALFYSGEGSRKVVQNLYRRPDHHQKFFRLVGQIVTSSFSEIGWLLLR